MYRVNWLFIVTIMLITTSFSYGRDDLITVTQESEKVPLATGRSISIESTCPENSVLVSGGGKCLGFLNTENKIVLTTSSPDSIKAAWNVECTNMNREAGEAQAKAWAICSEH